MTGLNILMPVFNRIGRGTYWRTFGLAQELASRGHKVTLLGAGRNDQTTVEVTQSANFMQLAFPSRFVATRGSGYDPGDIVGRIRWLRRNPEQYDLVHACEYLTPVAKAAIDDEEQKQAWVWQTKTALWEGRLDEAIAACWAVADEWRE